MTVKNLYPALRPSLDLNFARAKALDPRVSFSRGSIGTYVGADGLIKTAMANVPRFDYSPTTGESLGLLVEEPRTNLALRSEEFSDATWVKALATVTANTGSAPDGAITADTFTRTTTGPNYVTQNFTKAASAIQYTCSIFAKQSVGNFCAIRLQGTYPSRVDVVFNLSSGTISTAATAFGSFTGPSASITPYANGWYRLTVTGTSDATVGLVIHTSFSSNGAVIDGNDSVSNSAGLLWGAQLEAGAFATSYIPTTSATVTRAADVASIAGASFSSWYNQTEGTVFAEASTYVGTAAVSRFLWSIEGDANNVHRFFRQSDQQPVSQTIVGGASQSTFGFGAVWNTTVNRKLSYAYALNNFASTFDAVGIQTDTSGTLPTTSTLNIGHFSGGNQFGGTIKRLTYWPVRLPNATLQQLTQS
jgi:hypothetical protein